WQEPDGGFAAVGRTDLHEAVDREGPGGCRTDDRRSDFDNVYGDWDSLKAAESDPGNLSDEHALTLMTAEGELLEQVIRLADDLRKDAVGDDVTYVVNRNINFT